MAKLTVACYKVHRVAAGWIETPRFICEAKIRIGDSVDMTGKRLVRRN